jgi:hypothetical protein
MAAPRRKISKQERQGRDALMRVVNWVHILVIRRLFDEGWTTADVVAVYAKIQQESGKIAIAHAMPDWHYVDETQVADEVYAAIKGGFNWR